MSLVASSEGIWECTFVGECSVVCPKNVDPAAAIQRTKLATTNDWFRSVLPGGAADAHAVGFAPGGISVADAR
jgi:heterodisulfide reductase subunit C